MSAVFPMHSRTAPRRVARVNTANRHSRLLRRFTGTARAPQSTNPIRLWTLRRDRGCGRRRGFWQARRHLSEPLVLRGFRTIPAAASQARWAAEPIRNSAVCNFYQEVATPARLQGKNNIFTRVFGYTCVVFDYMWAPLGGPSGTPTSNRVRNGCGTRREESICSAGPRCRRFTAERQLAAPTRAASDVRRPTLVDAEDRHHRSVV
jgi:hypothetical protein